MIGTASGLIASVPLAYAADDDVLSRMEQEMHRLQEAQAHVQKEQEEINRDLVVLRSEMAKHRGTTTHGATKTPLTETASARNGGCHQQHMQVLRGPAIILC